MTDFKTAFPHPYEAQGNESRELHVKAIGRVDKTMHFSGL